MLQLLSNTSSNIEVVACNNGAPCVKFCLLLINVGEKSIELALMNVSTRTILKRYCSNLCKLVVQVLQRKRVIKEKLL